MSDRTLTGLDVIRFLCDFRNGMRPRIVEAIVAANPEAVYRPGTIPGGNGDGSVFATFQPRAPVPVDTPSQSLPRRLDGGKVVSRNTTAIAMANALVIPNIRAVTEHSGR